MIFAAFRPSCVCSPIAVWLPACRRHFSAGTRRTTIETRTTGLQQYTERFFRRLLFINYLFIVLTPQREKSTVTKIAI